MKYSKDLEKAACKIEEAVAIFKEIQTDAALVSDWGLAGDAQYYKSKLEEILLSDHGECGILAWLNTLKKDK